MPNWNSNGVAIHAPLEAVKAYLVPQADDTYLFNMHLLFPDRFPVVDPTGEINWDYDWAVDNTGSKRFPDVTIDRCGPKAPTLLNYDTARAPNNDLLGRLHEMTGWPIDNVYEEPGAGFEGTFSCNKGICTDEPREYQPRCNVCDQKHPASRYTIDPDRCVCDRCWKLDPISLPQ